MLIPLAIALTFAAAPAPSADSPDYVFAAPDLTRATVLRKHFGALGGKQKAKDAGDALASTSDDDTVDLLGMSSVHGAAAYKLKITHPSGRIEYHYLDKRSFLELGAVPASSPTASTGSKSGS